MPAEVSLLDLLVLLVNHKQLLLKSALLFLVLGVVVALLTPSRFTSSAVMIPETTEEGAGANLGGALSALRNFGIGFGGVSTGVTAQTFPEIMVGRTVRLSVIRDTLLLPELGRATLTDYFNQPPGVIGLLLEYTVRLPGKIKRALAPPPALDDNPRASGYVFPTEREEIALMALRELISVNMDEDSGIISVSVETKDPLLSVAILNRLIFHFSERIRSIHTKRTRDIYTFIQARFEEAEEALREAERLEAAFLDRNRNLSTAVLRAERDRLQRQVAFKEQLYSDLQTQLTQAELDLQKSEAVITVLEHPTPPIRPSGPKRAFMVVLFLILGGMVGLGIAVGKEYIAKQTSDLAGRNKWNVIQSAVKLPRFIKRK